jgi:chromosome segregation ATPase
VHPLRILNLILLAVPLFFSSHLWLFQGNLIRSDSTRESWQAVERADSTQQMSEAAAARHESALEQVRLDLVSETSELRSKLLATTAAEQEVAAKLLASKRRATELGDAVDSLRFDLEAERGASARLEASRAALELELKEANGRAHALNAASEKVKKELLEVEADRTELTTKVKALEKEVVRRC